MKTRKVVVDREVRDRMARLFSKSYTYNDIIVEMINYVNNNKLEVNTDIDAKVIKPSLLLLSEDTVRMLNNFGNKSNSYNQIILAILNAYEGDKNEDDISKERD